MKLISGLPLATVMLAAFAGTAFAAAPPAASTAPARQAAALPGQPLDRVIAVANDQPILESALEQRMARVSASLQQQGTPLPPEKAFRHQILERLITQKLLLQAAGQRGVQVSADQVNSALSAIAKRHGLTLAGLPKALAAQGQDYLAFRRQIKNQLTVHQLIQQAVASQIQVTPAEIDDYMEREADSQAGNTQYQLAQILIAFPSDATPADVKKTKQKAEALVQQLQAGANFAALAAANSDGPHALKGGVIGWIQAANLPTLLAGPVPKLKPGGITAPIAGPGGYHIVKLLAVRAPQGQHGTQYHVRHILIRPNPIRTLAQSKALAGKLRTEILAGKTTFAAAAKAYSGDPNSAGTGGDLGWKSAEDLPPPPFASTVESLPVNQISQPVKLPQGWDLIEVTGKRQGNATEAERENQAYQAIFQRKLASQLAQFKRVVRGQGYVHILDPADAGTEATNAGAAAANF